jgi:putative copper export protein
MLPVLRWIHLVAAAVWLGGLVVLAASVMALRRAGAPREHLQAVARQFGRVSWTAMLVAVVTGLWQVEALGFPWSYPRLHVKLALVALVIVVAFTHTLTAKRSSPALRGIVESTILLLSFAIYWAAVRL